MKQTSPPIAAPFAKLFASLKACAAFALLMLAGRMAHAQTTITGISPDGTRQFQPSATLTFNAGSPAGVTNVTVQLTTTSLTGQSFLKNLTAGHGLTITGPATSRSVSASLSSNVLYSAVIQAVDANGNAASSTVSFDTIAPSFTWEAEDYDYTSNGVAGLFIDNPPIDAYRGLDATEGSDYSSLNNNHNFSYRGQADHGLNTEPAGDKTRAGYGGANGDYDVGFNNGGNWANYTRSYPAGLYNVYMRGADGGGVSADSASLSIVVGGSPTTLGTFAVPSTGNWQQYTWVPLKDSGNNLVQFTADGSVQTLRVTTDGGNYNANFYMLVPANTNPANSSVTITNIQPDGTTLFQSSTTLSFTANSAAGIDPGDIIVQLGVTNLSGVGFATNLTAGNGLTVTGSATSQNVSAALTSNMVYTAFIQVTDLSGNPASATVTFDTINPAYTFEAEDFDFGGGMFFDNPQTNAYTLNDGVGGIDFINNNPAAYAYQRIGLSTETCGDANRVTHAGFQDYDLGNAGGGNWGNYTRNYPAGVYNIYLRAADGNGSTTDSASMSLVTSGFGTSSQTTTKLGTFSVPATGGWQKYTWVPLKDIAGNMVRFTGGSTNTLRFTTDNGSYNANFFLLMPADTSVKILPYVDNFQPDGSSMFQYTNSLSFVANSTTGIADNNIVVNLDGANLSGLTFSGSPTARIVSHSVATNAFHTVIVTLTDANGTTSSTNSFGTFSSANYTWEAEDYDHDSGQFIDNPQVDAYNTLPGTPGVDFVEADPNANGYNYRPAPAVPTSTDAGGDLPRAQFAGQTDYNIGFFGGGSWCNYTRQYPPGTYNVIGRFAEGAAATEATLSQVTAGAGTSNQTVTVLGTFFIPLSGWSSWEWTSLQDGSGNLVKVTLDGPTNTLRLAGSPVSGQPEVNVNFLMLVPTSPALKLKVAISGATVTVSFPTQTGSAYQVQYKNNLADTSWSSLGSPVAGNNGIRSVNDTVTGGSRFYRVQVQ
jgi:hypothetical protein